MSGDSHSNLRLQVTDLCKSELDQNYDQCATVLSSFKFDQTVVRCSTFKIHIYSLMFELSFEIEAKVKQPIYVLNLLEGINIFVELGR